MCFSAGASFGAGVVLTVIGSASIKKAKAPSQLMFAGIPFIFGLQQITEGFLWLSFNNASLQFLQTPATYIFLLIAQIIWPIWVPYSIMKLEPKEKRRVFEKVLVFTGALVSIYLGICLATCHVEASIDGYHITYIQEYPRFTGQFSGVFYVAATILPPFFSRIRRMWMLGLSILISYIITAVFYSDYIVSVWCFFASVISISIYTIVYSMNHKTSTEARLSTN